MFSQKERTGKMKFCTIAAVALTMSAAAFAQTGTMDQTSPNEFVVFTNGQIWQQEIKVGLAGQLEGFSLDFWAASAANTTVGLKLFSSGTACNPGSLVWSDTYTVTTTRTVETKFFDLSSLNLTYNVGDVFLVEFVPSANNGEATFMGNNNKYAGGSMCGNGFPYAPGDAAFTSYMNPGSGIQPMISITGNCPGSVTVDVTNASPNSQVGLLFGLNTGSTVIPPSFACAGTQLGITAQVQLVNNRLTDANGNATFIGNAPASACGRYLQVIDVATCNTSNVIQIP